jgi:hypothetical protein
MATETRKTTKTTKTTVVAVTEFGYPASLLRCLHMLWSPRLCSDETKGHFPDELSLFWACSSLDLSENPPPDPDLLWAPIVDPEERLRVALADAGVVRYASPQ